MIRRPPRSTQSRSSAASDVYKRQLKEEAHHMFVGTTGVQRVVERSAELVKEHGTDDILEHGGIPLDVIQKYLNFQYSVSMDLFGSEQSTNAGNYYSSGLKGRWQETRRKDDHVLLDDERTMNVVEDGKIVEKTVPMLSALNLDLRDEYVADCANGTVAGTRLSRMPVSSTA